MIGSGPEPEYVLCCIRSSEQTHDEQLIKGYKHMMNS